MARPITEIRSRKEEDPVLSLASSEVVGEIMEKQEDLRELMKLMDTFMESGLMDLASGLLKNYQHTISLVTDQVTTDKNRNFILNLLTIYSTLSSIDHEKLSSLLGSIASSLNSADTMKSQGSIGVLSLLSEMKDRDLSAGIRVVMSILKGFTASRKE